MPTLGQKRATEQRANEVMEGDAEGDPDADPTRQSRARLAVATWKAWDLRMRNTANRGGREEDTTRSGSHGGAGRGEGED